MDIRKQTAPAQDEMITLLRCIPSEIKDETLRKPLQDAAVFGILSINKKMIPWSVRIRRKDPITYIMRELNKAWEKHDEKSITKYMTMLGVDKSMAKFGSGLIKLINEQPELIALLKPELLQALAPSKTTSSEKDQDKLKSLKDALKGVDLKSLEKKAHEVMSKLSQDTLIAKGTELVKQYPELPGVIDEIKKSLAQKPEEKKPKPTSPAPSPMPH